MTDKPIPLYEAEAIELLGRKVAAEGYLVIPQVGNGTGANARRTADGLMVQTWPSRQLSITGIEYKRDRADWRRELRDGLKAEAVAKYCHFWLILAPQGVVPIGEVPAGWGLWEFTPSRRLLRTKPTPRQDEIKLLDYSFLAAILRAAEKVNRNEATLANDRLALRAEMDEKIKAGIQQATHDRAKLKQRVLEFEEASGISITNSWNLEKIGDGVRRYLEDPDRVKRALEQDRRELENMLAAINAALAPRLDQE